MSSRTFGVEEEFLLIDSSSRRPAPKSDVVLRSARARPGEQAQPELHRAQIETATSPCRTTAELADHLASLRLDIALAAASHGITVVASGTYPSTMGAAGQAITPDARYEQIGRSNAIVGRQQLICGCHIHVSVDDPDLAVRIMNRASRWLPCLIALAANSPFWEGEDTGFDGFRSEIWTRWPSSGPTDAFDSHAEYLHLVDRLVAARVILDRAMAYWDIRPSDKYPTLEFRVADVMLSVDDVVLVAALTRGLVDRCATADITAGTPRVEMLRAANWMAARSGVSGTLLDPLTGDAHPAPAILERLVEFLAPVLDPADSSVIRTGIDRVLTDGNGATRQRRAFDLRGSLDTVIDTASIATA